MRKLICFLLLALVLSSCDTWLEEEPRSSIPPDRFFTSAEEAIAAVNGIYAYLYELPGNYYNVTVTGTDVAVLKDPNNVPSAHVWYTLSTANPGRDMPGFWRELYRAVGAANMVINRVGPSDIDQEAKNRVIGEAKFLRGFYYFLLTKYWGGVPLWTEELNVDEVSTLPRASLEEVRAQIVKDLKDAASKLPVSYGAEEAGHATKGAARALLAKVYLYMEDWQKARDAALEVVNTGTYRLLPDYTEVFALDNENNNEIIFSIQYKQDVQTHNLHSWYEPPNTEDIEGFDGYGLILPTTWFVESFEEGDGRKDDLIITEWNGQPLSRPYFGPKFFDLAAPISNTGRNFIVLRYADVLLTLAEAENELNGPTPLAYESINKVRARAGLAPLSGLTKAAFREAVRLERAHELVGEGQRRWDLNRWGILVEAVKKVAEDNPRGAENVQPYHKLFPIPPAEIVKNPKLEQNPGYGG